ncbi:hypothetical protein C0J52_01686 [Blattella germanica]|nr:hypothetical protein C0J52_01686 [Blattella germanica]
MRSEFYAWNFQGSGSSSLCGESTGWPKTINILNAFCSFEPVEDKASGHNGVHEKQCKHLSSDCAALVFKIMMIIHKRYQNAISIPGIMK